MKKITKHVATISSAVLMGFAVQSAMADEGKVDFVGGVTDTTCVVTVNGSTGPNATVTLPIVSSKLLAKDKDRAGLTPMNFTLTGSSCTGGKARIYFVPSPNVNTAGRLTNTETGAGATSNVTLEILNKDKTTVDISKDVIGQTTQPISDSVDLTSGVTISHFVQYYASGQATAGTLKSSVDYEIAYQ